jgi:hypothetical protein
MTEDERVRIIDFFEVIKNRQEQAELTGLYAPNTIMLEVPPLEEFPLLHTVINRALDKVGLLDSKELIHGSGIRFGSGYVYYYKDSFSSTHKDPIDRIKYPGKSFFRTNIIFQTAVPNRGGEFYFVEKEGNVVVPLANNCMVCFSATDHLHGVSHNTGSSPRIALLIDCLVDTTWVDQFMKSK